VGASFSAPVQTGPGAHPVSCTMGTGSFPGVKSGRGVTLTPHPLLVPLSRKSRATLLLTLWAVRPVQSLSACTRVLFTFTLHIDDISPFTRSIQETPLDNLYRSWHHTDVICVLVNLGSNTKVITCAYHMLLATYCGATQM